jgi:hypothetical protein
VAGFTPAVGPPSQTGEEVKNLHPFFSTIQVRPRSSQKQSS